MSYFIDGRPRFEFYNASSSKEMYTNQDTNCICMTSGDGNQQDHDHDHHSSHQKTLQVPRLSLNERFRSSTHYRREPSQPVIVTSSKHARSPLPMLPPTTTKPTLAGNCIILFMDRKL